MTQVTRQRSDLLGTGIWKTSAHKEPFSESPSEVLMSDKDQHMIYPCPEEECVKAYSHFWHLWAHHDTGRHEKIIEHETLHDKTGKLYASKLSEGNARITILESVFAVASEGPLLPVGWALKTILKKKVRFTDKKKQFLTEYFNKGQGTGRESNPQQVSKARRDGLSERQGKYAGLSLMRFWVHKR